jgi:LmbE family N-acetylglucosaminyl deacetylase
MYCTVDDIHGLGTILGIWAHPDDESWCAAGIMAVARSNGQQVACITATRGDAGKTADESKWPQARLGEIRTQELEKALDVLGVREHYWLNYKDGQLAVSDGSKAIQEIAELIQKIQPDTILTFGPDGLTGHDDHKTMYSWARQAIKKTSSSARLLAVTEVKEKYDAIPDAAHAAFNVYFNVDVPQAVPIAKIDFFFVLPEDIFAKKLESLHVQESQTAGMLASPLGTNLLHGLSASEAFMDMPV